MFQSLPEEERNRVLSEEKMGGAKLNVGIAPSPHRAKSPSSKVHMYFSPCAVVPEPSLTTETVSDHRSVVGRRSQRRGYQLGSLETDETL